MGHADYDIYGKDIVCAAVSSITILTINNILTIDNTAIAYQNDDKLVINILKEDKIVKVLLINLVDSLYQLASDYPKNITIKEENNE